MPMQTKSGVIALLAISFAASGTAFAQRAYQNNGTKPFCLTSVGAQGFGPGQDWSAKLCVMGNEKMVIDPGPLPGMTLVATSGAGYFEADTGSWFDLTNVLGNSLSVDGKNCYCSLHVSKVEWDHDGKLTAIEGLLPTLFMDDKTPVAITSDVKTPRVANGNFYITLAGHEKTEYWLKVKFGKIAAIGKVGDKGETLK